MTRRLFVVMTALASGCAHTPYQAPAPGRPSATLMLRGSNESFAPNRRGGIFAVDGHPVASDQQFFVAVSPGRHGVAYLCPGWMYVDGLPTTSHEFLSGQQYELHCTDGDVYISP